MSGTARTFRVTFFEPNYFIYNLRLISKLLITAFGVCWLFGPLEYDYLVFQDIWYEEIGPVIMERYWVSTSISYSVCVFVAAARRANKGTYVIVICLIPHVMQLRRPGGSSGTRVS